MKAALKGVPNLSVLDGWWTGDSPEADIGADAFSLYRKLDELV